MNIGELIVTLGFKADTFKVKDFGRALADLPLKALGAIGAIAGVSLELGHLLSDAMGAAQGFQIFTSMTGLSSKELQRWSNVADQAGVQSGAVKASIMNISSMLGSLGTAHPDIGKLTAFAQLGGVTVNRSRTADQIFADVAKRVKNMEPQRAASLLGPTGISPELLRVFQMSSKEFGEKSKVGLMQDEDIEAASNLKAQFVKLAQIIEHSVTPLFSDMARIMETLMPAIKSFADKQVSSLHTILNMTDADSDALDKYIKAGGDFNDPDQVKYRSEHPWGLVGDWFKNLLPQPALAAGIDPGPRMTENNLNLTQNIHSTASAEEVARYAIEEANRHRIQASKHFGNAGK